MITHLKIWDSQSKMHDCCFTIAQNLKKSLDDIVRKYLKTLALINNCKKSISTSPLVD
jgi:hypothetical protein